MKNPYLNIFTLLFAFSACQNNAENQEEQPSEPIEKSGSIVLEGTKLTYKIEGEGPACLVVASSPEYFSPNLRNHLQLHFVDTRYTSAEYKPMNVEEYTLDLLFSDIDTMRAAMGLQKFIIIGHSINGVLAYEYAKRYPEYVSGVVMICSPSTYGTSVFAEAEKKYWASAPEERKNLFQEKMKALEGALDTLSPREAFIKRLAAQGPMRWHDANYDVTENLQNVSFNLDLANHLFGNLFSNYDMFAPDEAPEKPTFVAAGKSDYIVPPTLWLGKLDDLPNLTISYFEKSGHTPHFEESELFDKRLVEWVKNNN
jgi:proline iminopeptidase